MTRSISLKSKVLSAIALTVAAITSAQAGIVVSASNFSGGDNLIFNGCSPTPVIGSGALVSGCLQNSHSTVLNISGAGENLTLSGGQATLDAADNYFTRGNMALADVTKAIVAMGMSVNAREVNDRDATLSYTIDYIDPVTSLVGQYVSGSFNLASNGLNQFRITTTDGWLMTNIQFRASISNSLEDIRQIRFEAGDIPRGNVPVPGTLALMGLGVAAIVAKRRKA